jgi:hypothetical protein
MKLTKAQLREARIARSKPLDGMTRYELEESIGLMVLVLAGGALLGVFVAGVVYHYIDRDFGIGLFGAALGAFVTGCWLANVASNHGLRPHE